MDPMLGTQILQKYILFLLIKLSHAQRENHILFLLVLSLMKPSVHKLLENFQSSQQICFVVQIILEINCHIPIGFFPHGV